MNVADTAEKLANDVLAPIDSLVNTCLQNGTFQYHEIQNLDDEVMCWFIVTDWLHNELAKAGATTLKNEFGYFWGRTETGQNLKYDCHLQRVARTYLGLDEEEIEEE